MSIHSVNVDLKAKWTGKHFLMEQHHTTKSEHLPPPSPIKKTNQIMIKEQI